MTKKTSTESKSQKWYVKFYQSKVVPLAQWLLSLGAVAFFLYAGFDLVRSHIANLDGTMLSMVALLTVVGIAHVASLKLRNIVK